MSTDWLLLQRHYESCFERYGATPAGVDWPNPTDLAIRFEVQLTVLNHVAPDQVPEVLDIGCGPGLLLDYIAATGRLDKVRYRGIDLSPTMIAVAKARWPTASFNVRDILADPLPALSVDAVVMNGVLTESQTIPRARMIAMAEAIVQAAFATSRHGIAFNAMSRHVDWEREDLFHWGFDEVAAFLTRHVTRHIALRADYGLYEFTAFAWRSPQRQAKLPDREWWRC